VITAAILFLNIVIPALFQVFVGILLPGMCLRFCYRRGQDLPELPYPAGLLESLACGFLWNSAAFAMVLPLATRWPATGATLSGLKYGADLLVFLATVWRNPSVCGDFRVCLVPPRSLTVFLILFTGAAVGAIGIAFFPHCLDCGQLMWTTGVLEGLAAGGNLGAIGFSAMIYFPAALFGNLPLVTSAAGFKLLLVPLFGLAVLLLLQSTDSEALIGVAPAYFGLIIFSQLGQYGLLQLGKSSIFGVAFSVMYLAMLVCYDKGVESAAWPAAIYLSSAILSGVITVPYMAMITVLYVVLARDGRAVNLVVALFTWGAIPGAMVLEGYVQKPWIISASILFFVGRVVPYCAKWWKFRQSGSGRVRYWIPVAGMLLLAADTHLMPYRLQIVPSTNINGQREMAVRPPLDGVMTFTDYLTDYEGCLPRGVVVCGILGMLATAAHPQLGHNRSFHALSLFVPAMVCTGLLLCRLPWPPSAAMPLWDLTRDVSQWYGGIFLGLFTLVLLEWLLSWFVGPSRTKWVLLFCGTGLVVAAAWKNSARLRFILWKPSYTHSGGHRDRFVAELFNQLVLHPAPTHHLLISTTSYFMNSRYDFQMYGYHQVTAVSDQELASVPDLTGRLPGLFVGPGRSVWALQRSRLGSLIQMDEIQYFPRIDEGLYAIRHAFGPASRSRGDGRVFQRGVRITPLPDTFLREEWSGIPFSWVRRECDFDLAGIPAGEYLIEGSVFTPFNKRTNQLTFSQNDTPIAAITFDAATATVANAFAVRIRLTGTSTRLRLRSHLPEIMFPGDPRKMAFGLVDASIRLTPRTLDSPRK
jgi:hypothetical protein